jgi:hypothetical protein
MSLTVSAKGTLGGDSEDSFDAILCLSASQEQFLNGV